MMDDDDDDSCVMKYIEIVPLDNYSLSTDVKFSPCHVKVCILTYTLFLLFPCTAQRELHDFQSLYSI